MHHIIQFVLACQALALLPQTRSHTALTVLVTGVAPESQPAVVRIVKWPDYGLPPNLRQSMNDKWEFVAEARCNVQGIATFFSTSPTPVCVQALRGAAMSMPTGPVGAGQRITVEVREARRVSWSLRLDGHPAESGPVAGHVRLFYPVEHPWSTSRVVPWLSRDWEDSGA